MYCIASSSQRNLKLFNIEKLLQVGICRSVMAYKAFSTGHTGVLYLW